MVDDDLKQLIAAGKNWYKITKYTGLVLAMLPLPVLHIQLNSGTHQLVISICYGLWCYYLGYTDKKWRDRISKYINYKSGE